MESLAVTVCTWEPAHTLTRVERQQQALADGSLARLVKKFGKGTSELRSALARVKLVSMHKSLDGTHHCPECGALMDTVLAAPGIKDKTAAVRDVAEDFNKAIERTRKARLVG